MLPLLHTEGPGRVTARLRKVRTLTLLVPLGTGNFVLGVSPRHAWSGKARWLKQAVGGGACGGMGSLPFGGLGGYPWRQERGQCWSGKYLISLSKGTEGSQQERQGSTTNKAGTRSRRRVLADPKDLF